MVLLKNGLIISMDMSMDRPRFTGDILVRDGKVEALGEMLHVPDAQEIDCQGKILLPGFVDAHCHIGMWEDGMGDEGADGNECSDPITPEMRAIDGINPFDPCFQEAREAGVTTVVTGPGSANVVGGMFVALKTAGNSVEDMLLQFPAAMKAAMGENPKRVYAEQKASPYTRMAIASLFRKTMIEAQEYARKIAEGEKDEEKRPERNLSLEALLPVLNRELILKVHAHRADDILTALRLAREFSLKITIDHCTEGHLITQQLKEQLQELGAGVILGPLLSERAKIEMRNLSFSEPLKLYEAKIPFALMTDHPVIPEQFLPVCAALCVRNGLPEEAALAAITINAANITGLGDRVGSITPGKDADIGIFDGHPFDFRSHCVGTMINGKFVYRAF